MHLHQSGGLHLLPLIGNISLTPIVRAELRNHSPSLWPQALPQWANLKPLSSIAQKRALAWQHAGILHGGEAEALALAEELKPDWFLTDDAAARLMAESLAIETHGSIGVVLWAAANKLLGREEAETRMRALEQSSLWMSPKVRAAARAALVKIFA